MRGSVVAAVGMLSAVLLTGCSLSGSDDPSPAPPADQAAAAGVPAAGAPVPSITGAAPAPGELPAEGVAPPAPATAVDGPVARPPALAPSRSADPSRPAVRVDSLRTTWLTGTVTRGGNGPCYGIRTADGVAWALYADDTLPVTAGQGLRARVTPGDIPADCGAGRTGRVDRVQIAE